MERGWSGGPTPSLSRSAPRTKNRFVAKEVIGKFQRNPQNLRDPTGPLDDSVPRLSLLPNAPSQLSGPLIAGLTKIFVATAKKNEAMLHRYRQGGQHGKNLLNR
jgi:hypothetical protein